MITQIRMIGCQSWDDITIDLRTDLLNVIIAQNNTGKSVFYRIMKIAGSPHYYSKEDRKDLIRWGYQCARVGFAFSNDWVGLMTIYSNRVFYEYYEAGKRDGTLYEEPPEEMLKNLGLIVSSDGKFIANIIDAEQDLLLVNSNLANNYELIKLIVMCDDLDQMLAKLKELKNEFNQKLLRVADRVCILQRELENKAFYDVPALERNLERCMTLYKILKVISKASIELGRIPKVEVKDYEKLDRLEALLEQLHGINQDLKSIKISKKPVDDALIKLLTLISEIVDKMKSLSFPEFEDFSDRLAVLECIAAIQRDLKQVLFAEKDFGCGEACSDLLVVFNGVAEQLNLLKTQVLTQKDVINKIEETQQLMVENSTVVDCPVHGKVFYDGKECVVDS